MDGIELLDKNNCIKQVLDTISSTFPGLRRLILSLTMRMSNTVYERTARPLDKDFDHFVEQTPTLQDCVLSVPPGPWSDFLTESQNAVGDDVPAPHSKHELWRFIGSGLYHRVGVENERSYLNRRYPKFKSNSDSNQNGYWVINDWDHGIQRRLPGMSPLMCNLLPICTMGQIYGHG